MKVLLISTSERSGGGAIAARRLMEALVSNGIKAKLMVRDKQSDAVTVVKVGNKLPKLLERLAILPRCGFRLSRLWQADIANVGISITDTKEFKEADVVHLHWVNQGMLSLDEMDNIMRSGLTLLYIRAQACNVPALAPHLCRMQQLDCRRSTKGTARRTH